MPRTTQKPDQENLDPAKNVGQDDFEKIIDKNFSPGDEKTMEDRAREGAASDLAEQEASVADNESTSDDDIGSKEEQGDSSWRNNTSTKSSSNSPWFKFTKKRSVGLGLIVTILTVTLGLTLTLGPTFGLVNLKEVMVNKFGSRWSSYIEKRQIKIMSKKMSSDLTSGCTIKVKCRFKGMSSLEIKKFEKRNPGTKIVTEGRTIGGKKKIKGIQYIDDNGKQRFTVSSDFRKSLQNSSTLRKAVRNFNKPSVAYWRDLSAGKFYQKFKIYRGKPKTESEGEKKGATETEKEKIRKREIVREFVSGEEFDKFNAGNSSNTDAQAQADEQAVRDQVGDNVSNEADSLKADLQDSTKAIDPIPNIDSTTFGNATKTITNGGVDAVKGAFLGPIAGPEKACAAKRLIGSVGYLSKLMNTKRLISYSMLFMVTADLIKSGDADGAYAKHIGDLGSILSSRDPDTGHTFADSFGYQYAAEDKLVENTKTHKLDTAQMYPYMLGSGLTGTLLSIVNKLDLVPGVKNGCGIIENTFFQIGAGVVTVVADVFSGGSFSVSGALLGAGVGVAFAVAEQIATPILARAVAGAIVTGDEYGMDAGNAITSGFGAASAMNIRGHGGFPLSKNQAIAYDSYSKKVNNQVAQDEGLNYYLNPDNPGSFTTKFAYSIMPYFSNPSISSVGSVFGMTLNSIRSTTNVLAAQKGAEYDICTDSDYEKLDVAAGPFCDPQYGLDPDKVDANDGDTYDADKVIEYMCGSSVDSDASCGDTAYIDDEGQPKGEYASWVEQCVDSDKPITASGDNETPDICLNPDKTDDPVKYNMFYMYTFDTTIDDQHNDRDASTGDTGSNSAGGTAAPDAIDLSTLYEPSSDISCAPGSKDLGVQDGYHSGNKLRIRVCAINNVSETGDLSDVPGANGKLVVNSRISAIIIKMVKDAKQAGVNGITAAEGYRSMSRQKYLYTCGCTGGNPVATPGTSNHQAGVAIDWDEPMRAWVKSNGEKYGFKWFGPGDPPHFSPEGN